MINLTEPECLVSAVAALREIAGQLGKNWDFSVDPCSNSLLMSFCAVVARYADMEGRRDLEVDIRL